MAQTVFGAGVPSKIVTGPARQAVGLRLRGTVELRRALRDLGRRAPSAVGAELLIEGETIMTAAKKQTPVNFGILRSSGHVQGPDISGQQVTVTLGFGGPAGIGNHGGQSNKIRVGYAVVVHENLRTRHTVGNAKYLERPVLEAESGLEGRVARGLRRRLEAGF